MSRTANNAASSDERGGTATMAPPGTPQATPQPPLTEIESIEQLESRQTAITEGARQRLKFNEEQMLALQQEKQRLLALLGETAEEPEVEEPVIAPTVRRGGRVKGSKIVNGKMVLPGTAGSRKMKSVPAGRKVGSVKAGGAFNKTLAVLDVINQIAKKGVSSSEIVQETLKQYGNNMDAKEIASGMQALRISSRVQYTGKPREFIYYPLSVTVPGYEGHLIFGKKKAARKAA